MPRGNKYIKERRKQLGFSQAELAEMAEVSPRTLQFAESTEAVVRRDSLESIASALGVEYEQIVAFEYASSRDAFLEWPWSLARFLQNQIFPEHSANCENLEDASIGICKMRESWKSHLELHQDHPQKQIFNQADIELTSKLEHYRQRYLKLWKANPGVLQYATMNGERVGFSVVLPIVAASYEALRDGKISFMDISDTDILPRSQFIVLDSAVEFPSLGFKPWYRLTDGLSLSVFYQIANLSECVNFSDFAMLSFGASPLNISRLEAIGFKNRHVRMPEYGYSILEFAPGNSDLNNDEFIRTSTASHFSKLYKRLIGSDGKIKSKRLAVREVLRIYQRLVHRRERRLLTLNSSKVA